MFRNLSARIDELLFGTIEQRIERYRKRERQLRPPAVCSFCRKAQEIAGPLVEGPGSVFICEECIIVSAAIMEQLKLRKATGDQTHKN